MTPGDLPPLEPEDPVHTPGAIFQSSIHVCAWALLRVCSPARAHGILLRIGAHLPSIETAEDARLVLKGLSPHGTCLTRALTIAALAPTANVVIGVTPRANAPLFAHAWVEVDGVPLDPADVAGSVIARLRGPGGATNDPTG